MKLIQGAGGNFLRFGHLRVVNVPIRHVVCIQLQSTAFSDVIDSTVEESALLKDWVDNHISAVPYVSERAFYKLEPTVKIIIIDSNCMNSKNITRLSFEKFSNLELIRIKSFSFSYTSTLLIDSLQKLKCVIIEDWCFKSNLESSSCFLINCPSLQEIDIGNHSMEDYSMFTLNNLPSLRVLHIEGYCFRKCPAFILDSIITFI